MAKDWLMLTPALYCAMLAYDKAHTETSRWKFYFLHLPGGMCALGLGTEGAFAFLVRLFGYSVIESSPYGYLLAAWLIAFVIGIIAAAFAVSCIVNSEYVGKREERK